MYHIAQIISIFIRVAQISQSFMFSYSSSSSGGVRGGGTMRGGVSNPSSPPPRPITGTLKIPAILAVVFFSLAGGEAKCYPLAHHIPPVQLRTFVNSKSKLPYQEDKFYKFHRQTHSNHQNHHVLLPNDQLHVRHLLPLNKCHHSPPHHVYSVSSICFHLLRLLKLRLRTVS